MYFYWLSNGKKTIFLAKKSKLLQHCCQLLPVEVTAKQSKSVVFFCPFLPADYVNIQRPHVYTRIQFQSPQLENGCLNHSVGEEKQTSHLSMFTSSNKEVLTCPLSGDSLGWDYKSKGSCPLKHQGFRLQKSNMIQSGLSAAFFFLLGLSFCLTVPIPLEDSHEFTEKDLQFAEVQCKIIHLHVPIAVSCAVATAWNFGL